MLGAGEIIVLVGVAILIFNAKKLPQIGSALRNSFVGFKKGLNGEEDPRPTRDVKELDAKKPKNDGPH